MILDTGASKTVIAPSIAQSAGAQRLSFGKQAMTTASGTIDVDTFQLDSFLAIGLLRRNFPVACHELPLAFTALGIQGLLGLDFIYQKEICIDMRKKLISLI